MDLASSCLPLPRLVVRRICYSPDEFAGLIARRHERLLHWSIQRACHMASTVLRHASARGHRSRNFCRKTSMT